MKEYLFGIIAVGVISAVSLSVSHESMRGATRTALGVIMLLAVASPVAAVVGNITSEDVRLPEIGDISAEGGYEAVSREAFLEGIALAVSEEFGIDSESVAVDCHGFDFDTMRAEWVYVNLGREIGVDFRAVEEYVSTNFTEGGGCRVEFVLW